MLREELIRKWTDREDIPDEMKMEILEDIADLEVPAAEDPEAMNELNSRISELESDYADLKEKYIRRFSEVDPKDDPDEEEEEEEKEEVIDVKEI